MKTKQTGMWHWFRYTKTGHQIYSSLVFGSIYNRTEPELKAELSKKTGVELIYDTTIFNTFSCYEITIKRLKVTKLQLQLYIFNLEIN